MTPAPMLLKATCRICGLPVSQAPEVKAMCRVCTASTLRMQQAKPSYIDELVRRLGER
jgi:hypothetical protein